MGKEHLSPLRRYRADCKTATSHCGKVTAVTIKTIKKIGDGSARDCSALRRISLHNRSFFPTLFRCWRSAGANVFTPRERDTQRNEVVVDNDTQSNSIYLEVKSRKADWSTAAGKGFAQKQSRYQDGRKSFCNGHSTLCTHREEERQSLCRVDSNHSGNGRLCRIRLLPNTAQQCERCQIPCFP